jgi:hypothetical protein
MSHSEKNDRLGKTPSYQPSLAPGAAKRALSHPLMLSVIALGLSAVALLLALAYGPLGLASRDKNPGLDPLGPGLKKYDLSSPEAALKSRLTMGNEVDIRALMELESYRNSLKQKLATLKVEKQVPFDDKAILLVSYKDGSKDRFTFETYAQHKETGYWLPTFVSTFDIERTNPQLANEIHQWEAKENEARNASSNDSLRIVSPPAQAKAETANRNSSSLAPAAPRK